MENKIVNKLEKVGKYLISVKSALFVFNMDRNSVLEKNLIEISNVIIVNPFFTILYHGRNYIIGNNL